MAAFALDLDHGGIRLLRRVGSRWECLDEVSLGSPDLSDRLTAMRERAEALAEGSLETELVIPETQILYTRLPMPETGANPDAGTIASRLEGLTPCPVEELVFDWRVLADDVAVAALDINTLDEAESFALKYRFNPVRFSARPRREQFPDHPDFGPTQFVRDTLEKTPALFASRRAGTDAEALEEEDVDNLFAPNSPVDAPGRELPPGRSIEEDGGAPGTEQDRLPGDAIAKAVEDAEFDTVALGDDTAHPTSSLISDTGAAGFAAEDAPVPAAGTVPKAPPPLRHAPPPRAVARTPPPKGFSRTQDWRRTAATVAIGASVMASLVAFALFLVAPEETPDAPAATGDASEIQLDLPVDGPEPLRIAGPPGRSHPDRLTPEIRYPSVSVTQVRMADRADIVPEGTPDAVALREVFPEAPFRASDIWQVPPLPAPGTADDGLEGLYVASIDPVVTTGDALALVDAVARDGVPVRPSPVPERGRSFDLDEAGRVIATAEGAETPDGIVVRLGRPALVPPDRPAVSSVTPDPEVALALAGRTPRARPAGLIERYERARLGGRTRAELGSLTPLSRPPSAQETTLADASLVATDRAVASSPIPAARPDDLAARAVALAVAQSRPAEPDAPAAPEPKEQVAAVPAPEPTVTAAPAAASPSIPTAASVARQATFQNAMNLKRLNLIGVYGSARDRRALVRLPSGRFVKVEVGDRVDGGRVASIGDGELRYVKGGRNVTLKVPSG